MLNSLQRRWDCKRVCSEYQGCKLYSLLILRGYLDYKHVHLHLFIYIYCWPFTCWCLGDKQSVWSSVLVVSRWLWPGNRTFLEVASMVVTWWIGAFFAQCWGLSFPLREYSTHIMKLCRWIDLLRHNVCSPGIQYETRSLPVWSWVPVPYLKNILPCIHI